MKGLYFVFFCCVFKCGKGMENLYLMFVLVDKYGFNFFFGGLFFVFDLKRYFYFLCGILCNFFYVLEISRCFYCEVMYICLERGCFLLRLFF